MWVWRRNSRSGLWFGFGSDRSGRCSAHCRGLGARGGLKPQEDVNHAVLHGLQQDWQGKTYRKSEHTSFWPVATEIGRLLVIC